MSVIVTEDEISGAVNNCANLNAFTSGYVQPLGGVGTSGTCYYPYTNWGSWCSHPDNVNKTEKAYQVIRGLMKAKVLEIKTLNQFFEAMDEVVKVL